MTVNNPFLMFEQWLEWLESHDGRLHRRKTGGSETDFDAIALVPTGNAGRNILTVGDLKALVAKGKETR